MASSGKIVSNCNKCNEADTESMVQCDTCDRWYHFTCVGVDEGVSAEDWNCEMCLDKAPPNLTETAPGRGQTTKKRGEGMQLGKRGQGAVESNSASVSHVIHSNKHAAPNAAAAEATVPEITKLSTRKTPLVNANKETANTATKTIFMDNSTSAHTDAHQKMPNSENFRMLPSDARADNMLQKQMFAASNEGSGMLLSNADVGNMLQPQTFTAISDDNEQHLQRQVQLKLDLLEEESKLKQQYLQRKYEILNQNISNSTMLSQNVSMISSPSPTQIAARHVLPKSLPSFAGDPEEWPIFISAYETSTEVGGFSNAENLIRLQSSLKGRARELVRGKLLLPEMVGEIIQTLRMCFGRPEYIIERMIERARKAPAPKDKLESLIDFALCVKNICATMEACHAVGHLNNPMLVKELVEKLPNHMKLTWAMQQKKENPIVIEFSNWLYSLGEAAAQVVTPSVARKSASLNVHATNQSECVVCKGSHKLARCADFAKLTLDEKWEIVKKHKLCRSCLNAHSRRCFLAKECGTDGCKSKHNQLLHRSTTNAQNTEGSNHEVTNVHTHDARNNALFRIIPIEIFSNGKSIRTFAFLDEGSSTTLIEEQVFRKLGVKGEAEPLCLRWTGDTIRQEDRSRRSSIIIAGSNHYKYTLRDVHTVNGLHLPRQTIDMQLYSHEFPHLKGLPIDSYEDAKPTVLIGANNWSLAVALKVREGLPNQPIATKTRLGWTIQGPINGQRQTEVLNFHICSCEKRYEELHEEIKRYFEVESPERTISSPEDSLALQIVKSSSVFKQGKFEVGLPWRNPDQQLNNSLATAEKRASCLEKKFRKNPELKLLMTKEIHNLLQKNYARKVSEDELVRTTRVWYLPIFVIKNPNKPHRIRIVWDAAAKSDGRCLNDYLLSGPDLLVPLVDILLAFRVGKIAVCGDISEMFHQVKVRREDMHVQRFLWYEASATKPTHYVMTSLTFGMNCAPFIAHYIKNTNAERFIKESPRATQAIKEHHYVDDFIDSVDTVEEAIQLATEVKTIHLEAGFYMRNWISNSSEVAQHLNDPTSPPQSTLKLSSHEKVLGMYWDPNNDAFEYTHRCAKLDRDIIIGDVTPTKREVLQALMSIFDPLGFVSCHTIGLKILLQQIWRTGINWDEPLTNELDQKWRNWKEIANQISEIKIPRCYCSILKDAKSIQLHTFVDAGEDAFAAVSYLRVQHGGRVTVSIVAAKGKVAPVRPLTIPRLELQAAVVGVRLADKIRSIKRIPITSSHWWSDSKTVLRWLRMDPKGFKQFVMHRVGEILESSNVSQWRWVPSKMNPADHATKVTTNVRENCDEWINGPDFLKSEPSDWPTCNDLEIPDEAETRHHLVHVESTAKEVSLRVEYFSDWKRLLRSVSNIILFYEKLKINKKLQREHRSIHERIQLAEKMLFREAQRSGYHQEVSDLQSRKVINKKSKLISLNIYLDSDGILKIHSRTEYLANYEAAIVLPKNHHVTMLLVKHYHTKNHHQLHEASINEIRGKFYIPQLRVLYKSVRKKCQRCKNLNASPTEQQMAPLPKARLAAFERPFSYTGIDYFGPIMVAVGRRREKRWGVLFTCLTIRAVHIEISHSLDTSSCMMCLQNFMARRGVPKQIYTDNGTNFRATEKLLKEMVQNIDHHSMAEETHAIQWIFIPPSAPHMGGAWERLIRSVKNVLYSIQPNHNWNDESLRNALAEVEFILNSRPLTFVSLEYPDDEAITPNHLLLGSSNGHKPVGPDNLNLRQRWQQSQLFADEFWRRWIREYTPTLVRRTKWFEKRPPLQPGDIVIIVDDSLPRNCWLKGVVEKTIVARDNQVRRAVVRTKMGTILRPTTKLAKLDVGNETK